MKQYRGYYIDHVIFHSEADIDAHIKSHAIEQYQMMCRMFAEKPTMELSRLMGDQADYMHKAFGMAYSEIEQIEIAAITAA